MAINATEKNIASARGEALAANLLAQAALQAVFMFVPPQNRADLLSKMSAFIDDTLNRAGPGAGDGQDELNTMMREIARFQTMQVLDHLTRGLQGPST